jgi:hypothetical protein
LVTNPILNVNASSSLAVCEKDPRFPDEHSKYILFEPVVDDH